MTNLKPQKKLRQKQLTTITNHQAETSHTIKNWPVAERPREKLLDKGAAALSDAELLAIFLRTGSKGITAVDLARQLLTSFGGLKPLLQANQQQFCQKKGLGPAKYTQLQAVMEIAKRHLLEQICHGDALINPEQTKQYLSSELANYPHEVFACLFLDTRHRVISFDKLFFGTIDNASIYPREVVKVALQKNAAAIIFAHNHPSGNAQPSDADKQITQRLIKALDLVDIRVLDHFVIGDNIISFAEQGLL